MLKTFQPWVETIRPMKIDFMFLVSARMEFATAWTIFIIHYFSKNKDMSGLSIICQENIFPVFFSMSAHQTIELYYI